MKCLCFFFMAFAIMSCSSGNESELFNVSTSNINLNWESVSKDIEVIANHKWDMSSNLPDWLNAQVVEGNEKNKYVIRLFVHENRTDESRLFTIHLSSETMSHDIVINQLYRGRLIFKTQSEYRLSWKDALLDIPVEANVPYDLKILDDGNSWITDFSQADAFSTLTRSYDISVNDLDLKISPNYQKEERTAEVVISNGQFAVSDTIKIVQGMGLGYHPDGEVQTLQHSKLGHANIIIMGDGFVKDDFNPDGWYDKCIKKAANYFFSVEPYTTYKEYFSVYAVYAHSEQKGVARTGQFVNNKFQSTYGSGTGITCDDDLVMEYAKKVQDIPKDTPLTIILVLNDSKYAGTTMLMKDGNSIAMCPMSEEEPPGDFEGIIHHEVGGHAFGFLADEYIYNDSKIPVGLAHELEEWHELGFQMNLDLTNDPNIILWKDFIGLDGYEMVGVYEGGAEYQYGVWRSEENSCMNKNIPYFNVQSRWTIVKRIMEMSGKELTLHEFLVKDKPIADTSALTRSGGIEHKPLGTPIWKW